MQIIKYIDLFIGAVINILLYVMIVSRLFNLKENVSVKSVVIGLVLSPLAICIINIFNKDIFKILLTFPFVVIAIKYLFDINYNKSVSYSIIVILYTLFSEIIAGIAFSFLPFDYSFIFNNILGTTTGAIIVVLFTIPLLCVNKLSVLIKDFSINMDNNKNVVINVLILLIAGALGYKNVINSDSIVKVIMNIIITAIFVTIFYAYYKENTKSEELSKNYNEMLHYLEAYEKELVEKRKIIHDYKNQIIIINGYLDNNKKLKEYLNEIMDEQRAINENSIIKNIDKIPLGLKGLIYYKFSHVENLFIDLQVKTSLKKFDTLSSKTNKKVLKIIGVLIDNAIDAAKEENNKYVNISFSIRKNIFEMNLTNPCSKKVDLDNISSVGFSTKGKNRGYGLAMVNDLLKNEDSIKLLFSHIDNEFIAKLEVYL